MKIFERRSSKGAAAASPGAGAAPPGTDHLNLLLCGAQRCGTSSLKYYLQEHPEIGFLNNDDLVADGHDYGFPFASPVIAQAMAGEDPAVYRAIARRFAGKKTYVATKQPYFMVHPHVPFNLREHLPDVKLVFTLRNPVDAAYSAFRNGQSKGRRQGTFEEALRLATEAGREVGHADRRGKWVGYFKDPDQLPLLVDRGFYYQQLVRFYTCLPAEQILVLRFDHFTKDTRRTMARVLEFLGLDPSFEFTRIDEVRNAAPRGEPMDPGTRARLNEIYRESNRKLLGFLGWPEDLWDG